MRALTHEVALVTGVGSGIGKAVALKLADAGMKLALTSRSAERLGEVVDLAESRNVEVIYVTGDASNPQTASKLAEAAVSRFGHIDLLVNNVGVGAYRPFTETSLDDFDDMMATNVRSTFLFTKVVVPVMIRQHYGQIITISSGSGIRGYADEAVYCATKFAQAGLSEALDQELLNHNIKVSTIFPGGVKTNFAIGNGRTAGDPGLDEMLDATDVAEAVHFVAAQEWKSFVYELCLRPMSEPR